MPSQALAQCAPASGPLNISSGNSCVDSNAIGTFDRSSSTTDVVNVSGAGSQYTGIQVNLESSGPGSGAHATDGGTIVLNGRPESDGIYQTSSNFAQVTTNETNSYGLYADSGGQIKTTGAVVYTWGDGSHGIYATGLGSNVNMNFDGVQVPPDTGVQAVVTSGVNAYGVYAANGGTVEMTGITGQSDSIITDGAGSSALVVDSKGSITLNILSAYVSADNTAGAKVSDTDSSLILNNSYINTYGNNSAGMIVSNGGTGTLNGNSAVVTGNYHGTLIDNSAALVAQGLGSTIEVNDGSSVTTYGANSAGAVAQAGGTIDFKGYGIFTYETGSAGAVADGTDGNGTASNVILTDTIVRTTGPSAAGLNIAGGGNIVVTGSEVTTGYKGGFGDSGGFYLQADVGKNSNGANIIGTGSTLTATNSDITTTGDGAIGVAADQSGIATITGGTIFTQGNQTDRAADGVWAARGGKVTLTGGTIVDTSGTAAAGLHAGVTGEIDATNATIATHGTGAFGALADAGGAGSNGGVVKIDASTVTTDAAAGLSVAGNGQITTTNTAVTAGGNNSSGILGTGDGKVTMTGGSLSATGDLISGTAGNVVADLTGVAPTTGSGILVHALGGTTSGNFTNMAMTGNVVGEVGARANATLKSSVLTGVAINADNMTVDANSTWNMTASSTVNSTGTSTTNNTGLIVFTPPSGGAYKTLTTSNFVGGTGGAIGTVVLNTYLGSDGSPSDQIVIDGGTATGSTALTIVNNGGPGAATIHDGIEVVHVINGGTTSTDAFHLTRAVAAGAYDYNLFRGGLDPDTGTPTDENWFLRNVGLNESTQTVLPYAQILSDFSFATLGTLQQRTGNRVWPNGAPPETIWCKDPAQNFKCRVSGEQASVYANGGPVIYGQGAWGRIGGQYSSFDPKIGSSYTQSLGFMQAGYEGAVYESATGTMTLGAYGTIGTARADIDITRDPATLAARAKGKITTTGYGIGANLTWLGNNGFYADAIAQFTWYDSSLSNKPGGNNQGWSGAASIEAGKRMDLGSGWALVPQAQLAYSSVDFEKFTDVNGARQELGEGNSLQGRIGVRIEHLSSWQNANNKTDRLQVYGIGNLSYQFVKGTKIDVANVSVQQQNKRLWGEVGLGGTYAWNDAWSAYGEADYATALSAGAGDNYTVKGTLGIRYNW
ncbi:autotransporter outer membrane beta-barrel domain-containing protein [Labrys sp. WJW]|uniref:autotransporter outer membrane beta-barrel domain-containing protein n=1 Tax=Labrys sp. WJW TaxID=1737983 RepID=UPI000A58E19D|nr:autotransporter outer membrane beta-barrel domain-containing protein [Labrys sp. WJW]